MRVGVITASELARTHGTGAQLLKLYVGHDNFWHFYWFSFHGTESEIANSTKLSVRPVVIPKVGRLIRIGLQACGVAWWYGANINRFRFRRLIRRIGPFDVAHVVIADEVAATHARSLLVELACPYVLQIYDLMHEDGLDANMTPQFVQLIKNAKQVFGLTSNVCREIRKFRSDSEMIGIGVDLSEFAPTLSRTDGTLRIVITGRPYEGGAKILADALTPLKNKFPGIEVHYVGAHFRCLPEKLQLSTTDHGFCESDEEYLRLLSSMSIAYLTGPDRDDCLGKYSFPSRVTDLCVAGLPIVACIPRTTATADVFAGQELTFYRRVDSVSQLPEAICSLADSQQARKESRLFAEKEFDLRVHQQRLMSSIERAAL